MKNLSVALLVFLGLSTQSHARVYDPKTFTLKNGLEVVVVENNRAPVVTQMVWYKVGTIDDPEGKSGIAHYLEHLMFKGTPTSPAGSMMKEVTRIGGELNAATSTDFTYYYETVPADQLEAVMKLEAGRMANLEITDALARPELDVVLEERRMRFENNPLGKFHEALNASFFWHHPVRHPTIGWEHEIKSYTTKDAQDFYNTWYTPNNAILVIAGDVKAEEVKVLAEKYYGVIPIKTQPKRLELIEPPHGDTKFKLTMTSSHIDHPYYVRRYFAPNFKAEGGKHLYALQVLQNILGKPATGRFSKVLVEKLRLATGVNVDYQDYTRAPGNIMIMTQPTPEHSLKDLEKGLEDEIKLILTKGITPEEVEKAKKQMLATLAYTKDNVLSGAEELGSILVLGQGVEEIEAWPDRIKAVTVEAVNEAFRLVFDTDSYFVGTLIPEKKDSKGAAK